MISRILAVRKKRLVMERKQFLSHKVRIFTSFPQVTFIFQTFNKQENIVPVLGPFLQAQVKNIILFADVCVDDSAKKAHSKLAGPNHLVIQCNDTHEIRNYRLGIKLASSLSCDYAMLLQDDDIYSDDVLEWIESALRCMRDDSYLAMVGGAGGANYEAGNCREADSGLTSARFETWQKNGVKGFRLGDYQSMSMSEARPSPDGSSREYVATVSRAPQLVRISTALELGFFPSELEPFQYDDDYNCLLAWTMGHKILHMPTSCKTGNVGVGGMRLYNSVTRNSRPAHFCHNWNFVLEKFGSDINSGKIGRLVAAANRGLDSANASAPDS